jgi:flagellar hook-associated protein 3 FlgL
MIARQVTSNLQTNLKRLSQLQEQLSSTKQFSQPSDAPIDFTQALNLREVLTSERRYVRNIERGVNLLNLNDSIFGSVGEAIQRGRELALSGASDSLDDDARTALASEVDELLQQVVQFANSRSGEVYIYSGNETGTLPFEVAEINGKTTVEYLGDLGDRAYEVGQGVTVPVLLDGVEAFLGDRGELTSTVLVGNPEGALNAELAGELPPATSGTFEINGETISVNLATDSLEDLRDNINEAEADVVASIDDLGRLQLKSLQALDMEIKDGTSNVMQTLGLYHRVQGQTLGAPGTVTPATTLAALGVTPGGFQIEVGGQPVDVDLSGAATVGDVITAINGSGLPLNAMINSDGSGLVVSATETVESLEITELSKVFGTPIGAGLNRSTTLASLGIATPLGSVNITNDLVSIEVDLSSATTVGDVLDILTESAAGVDAVINEAGTGIDIRNRNPRADLVIAEVGAGTTAADLGILGSDTTDTADELGLTVESYVNLDESQNIFSGLIKLSEALRNNDRDQIYAAIDDLDVAMNLNISNRATVGARTNRFELALTRYADSDLFLSELISQNEDIDLAKTITDLRTQETVLEATLNSGARLLLPSLLDFLPV